jgi:alpha-L-rhamnosidase
VLHRARLTGLTTFAALIAILAAFTAAIAIASEPASAQEWVPEPYATWEYCAPEGGTCRGLDSGSSLNSGRVTQIRYGDYHIPWEDSGFGNWSMQTRGGAVACTNTMFGDPFPNRTKHCEYDASAKDWSYCAPENGTCNVGSNTRWVRYGSSDPYAHGPDTLVEIGWTVKKKTGSISCTNSEFGGDPHYGYVKGCWIRSNWNVS